MQDCSIDVIRYEVSSVLYALQYVYVCIDYEVVGDAIVYISGGG